jgi:hypothetical protein
MVLAILASDQRQLTSGAYVTMRYRRLIWTNSTADANESCLARHRPPACRSPMYRPGGAPSVFRNMVTKLGTFS